MDSKSDSEVTVENASHFIVGYIAEMSGVSTDTASLEHYVEHGLLDSFSLMNLIVTVEQYFSIKFDVNEINDERFKTVTGLANIVFDKCKKR